MTRLAASAVAVALLLSAVLAAQEGADKKKASPHKKVEGTWTHTAGDLKIVFAIKKHTLHCTVGHEDKSFSLDADYAVTKDGVLFARVNKVGKTGVENAPGVGTLFSFRFAVKDGTLTLSELQGPGGNEARQAVEGEYEGGTAKSK